MSFLKKVGKLAKKGAKLYASYQTGGLSNVALSALSKKKAVKMAAMPMLANSLASKYGGGFTATPASFVSMGSMASVAKKYGSKALRAVPYVGTAATVYDVGKGLFGGAGASGTYPRKKYRRINPANVKALRRSIRRIKGAEKLFRTVLQVQGKHHTGIKPKSRGKR